MGAPVYNIEADRGGLITVTVDLIEADGTARDLTGYTGEMQVRASADDVDVLATGTVTVTPATGRVVGEISSTATDDAVWVSAFYDVRITSDSIDYEYVVHGKIKLRPTVTR